MCHPPLSNQDPRATMNHHSPICYLRVIFQEKDRSIALSAIRSTNPGRSPPNDAGRAFTRQVTPVPRSQPVTCFWSATLTTANVSRQHEWPKADINRPKKKKCSIHFIFFYLLCFKKKKKKIPNSEFWKKKKKTICGIYFLILSSWAEIEPSHWATKLRSRAKTISRSEPLSHWPAIWGIEPWSDQAKLRFKSLSQKSEPPNLWAKIQAKPSWAAFWALFCYQTQGFIKITPWIWGGILRNIV